MTEPRSPRAPYSHGHHTSVLASHRARTADTSCGYLLDRLEPGLRLLDVGCGPGSITLDLAEMVGPTGSVLGIDAADTAVRAATDAAAERGLPNVRFAVGDLFDLEMNEGPFDVVHAHQVLQHVHDPVEALRRLARWCTPDGLIAARDADYGAMVWYPESAGLTRWRDLYTGSARAAGAQPDAGRRLRAWARTAGLEILDVSTSTWTYATPESAAWWGTSQAQRVRHSAFAEQARRQGLTATDIESIARSWEEWGACPDAWFVVVHGEVLARPGRDEQRQVSQIHSLRRQG